MTLPMIIKNAILRYNHPWRETISFIVLESLLNKGLYNVEATATPIPNSAKLRN